MMVVIIIMMMFFFVLFYFRSVLTNTHNVERLHRSTNLEGYYNEAFEEVHESETDVETEIPYGESNEKRNTLMPDKLDDESYDTYLRSVQARKEVFLADVHADRTQNETSDADCVDNDPVTDKDEKDDVEQPISSSSTGMENVLEEFVTSDDNIKELKAFEACKSDDIFRKSQQDIVAHKPPILKPLTRTYNSIQRSKPHLLETVADAHGSTEEIMINKPFTSQIKPTIERNKSIDIVLKKKTLKPLNPKKKKRSLLSHMYQKNSASLDEAPRDSSVFYSEPRRQSEPRLFLYNEEAADPHDATLYTNQNKILFNPYYTEASLPVNKNQKRRSFTGEDENEIDAYRHGYKLKRERSLPVLENIYNKHVSDSTWM